MTGGKTWTQSRKRGDYPKDWKEMKLSVELVRTEDQTVTESKALAKFYLEKLPEERHRYIKVAQGFPLESPHGTLNEQGHIEYTLLHNCTMINGKRLDENGFIANNHQITVGPLRAEAQEAAQFLTHPEAALCVLHGEGVGKNIIDRRNPYSHGYASTAQRLEASPENRMLHIVSDELKGKDIFDLEDKREAAQRIESKKNKFPVLTTYEVPRVVTIKDVDKETETEIVVTDPGSAIDPEIDMEASAEAVDEVFNKALGEQVHPLPQLTVPAYPATDKDADRPNKETETAKYDVGRQINGLSEKVENGFQDTADSVQKVNVSIALVGRGVDNITDLTGKVLERQESQVSLAEKHNQLADGMIQQLVSMRSMEKTPAQQPSAANRRKRAATTPQSETGEDTDMKGTEMQTPQNSTNQENDDLYNEEDPTEKELQTPLPKLEEWGQHEEMEEPQETRERQEEAQMN
ncbi:hypothetical protein CYMTET_48794 [Cymbomonas tetramitiformis]|uniref:Uncharacterized protein n=1 Tax=Cymbomonas tetramitiformis TaxID=36881 RepID=A0AAE0BSM7_9CHLO|nr:hypothetical protein CYMTET_48794 [Cymbomonas tetramitiformis]